MNKTRKDKNRIVFRKGEGQRSNGSYYYRWLTRERERHYIYAKTLEDLREKEKTVGQDAFDGIKHEGKFITVNDLYCLWRVLKCGLKDNTFQNYGMKAMTLAEQNLLLEFLKNSQKYYRWYPLIAVMLGTGLRTAEATGLRWEDIDLENGTIDVNHTLVYYCHRKNGTANKCCFNIHTPKTTQSHRIVPMLDFVKETFLVEKKRQEESQVKCSVTIDGYSDFIFVDGSGRTQHNGTINKAIRKIIRDCNDTELKNNPHAEVLLPHFSCHSLRHTFTVRMCESGVNVKVIQYVLGHKSITTTLAIYEDVMRDMGKTEKINQGSIWNDQPLILPLSFNYPGYADC